MNNLVVADRPDAQSISNVLWALYKFKHVPSGQVATVMVERMVALCRLPGQQVDSQAISNVMLACADLRLAVDSVCIETFVSVFLNLRQQAVEQQFSNLAWSLAVLGFLRMETLNLLLCSLSDVTAQHDQLLPGTTNPFSASSLIQWYHALDWLQPLPGAPALQHQAWSQLRDKLNRLGRPPPVTFWPHDSTDVVHIALTTLKLRFTDNPMVKGYRTVAVLQPTDSGLPVILIFKSTKYIRNQHARYVHACILQQSNIVVLV